MSRLTAIAFICLASWCPASSQGAAGMGLEIFGVALDIADMFIQAQDHEEVMDKLKEIQSELDQIKQKLDEIEQTLKEVVQDVKDLDVKISLQQLNDAHVAVMTALDQLQANRGHDSDVARLNTMADTILGVTSDLMKARENYYEALMGTLPGLNGKTLPQVIFEKTGLLPVHLMQGVVRTLSINQAVISWAYMQKGLVPLREQDKNGWTKKHDAAWDKNYNALFKIASCKWSTNHTSVLLCDSTRMERATVLVNGSQPILGHTDCSPQGSGYISIPTRGSDHDDWGFDVSCGKNAATGIQGYCNVPSGHSVSYVSGFKLHCKNAEDTADTAHLMHDCEDISWNIQLDSPLLSVKGCINVPNGHHITYWSSAKFTTVSGQTGDIKTSGNPCDDDSTSYAISCSPGYCMKRFQGFSDVPNGHAISYISCLNIYCGICTDTEHKVPEAELVV